MMTAEKLLKNILLKYNKKPSGWEFLIGKGEGYFDILISRGSEAWQIKLDTIYKPNPIGVGTKIGKVENVIKSPYSFGFRPIPEKCMIELMDSGISTDIIKEIMETKPVPINKIRTAGVMQGPIVYSGSPPVELLSEKHKSLDLKLQKELHRLLNKSGALLPYV